MAKMGILDDEPEPVMIPVTQGDAAMRLTDQSEAQTKTALAGLRRSFDELLSVLQDRSVASRLQAVIRGRAKLGGKVKAGSGH
jgi:hypothetical protein